MVTNDSAYPAILYLGLLGPKEVVRETINRSTSCYIYQ